jgi:hypothetical protein
MHESDILISLFFYIFPRHFQFMLSFYVTWSCAVAFSAAYPAQFINVDLFCRCSISDVVLVLCGIHWTWGEMAWLATRYKVLQSGRYSPILRSLCFLCLVVYNSLRDWQGSLRDHGKNKQFRVINTINCAPNDPSFFSFFFSSSLS